MNTVLRRVSLVVILLVGAVGVRVTLRAEDSWKKPLAVKERAIEEGIRKRHNILGLYPSMVEIPATGDSLDITTRTPFADIQHAVCWTSNYLAGLSYKYAVLKKSGAAEHELRDAQQRADEVFEAVYRCQRVTGVRGLQARGYLLGHGETYAEREASSKLRLLASRRSRWAGVPLGGRSEPPQLQRRDPRIGAVLYAGGGGTAEGAGARGH